MDEVVDALRAQQHELKGYVAGLGAQGLQLPSRCVGWTVADVLLHLAQTDEMAVASLHGDLTGYLDRVSAGVTFTGTTVDDWAGVLVDAQRGDPVTARDRWLAAADAETAAFAEADPRARVQWIAGEMAARTLATTRLTETWIHTVDVAVAFGPEPAPTDRLRHTVRLVWRTLPYALAQDGLTPTGEVAFVLDAPDRSTWTVGEADAATTIRGAAVDLCTVAGQRATAAERGLTGTGPDADAVLRLMRTFA